MTTLPTAMPFTHLVDIVAEMMQNAADNGYPVWDWSVEDIAGDLTGHSDDILACDQNDIERAVEAAICMHRKINN